MNENEDNFVFRKMTMQNQAKKKNVSGFSKPEVAYSVNERESTRGISKKAKIKLTLDLNNRALIRKVAMSKRTEIKMVERNISLVTK